MISKIASPGRQVNLEETKELTARVCTESDYRGQRVLLIIPDGTRTAPIGMVFRALHEHLAPMCTCVDVLVALGTHPPMTEAGILARLEISPEERAQRFASVRLLNHAWDDPSSLRRIGTISADEIHRLSEGRFRLEVPVDVNRRVFEYDRLIIVGPVFPHEVVGFSGGNKYLFPGIAGAGILDFFHWLGAVITNAEVIGRKRTPVREVVDYAASLVPIQRQAFCLVVEGTGLAGIYAGDTDLAWTAAVDHSQRLHILRKNRSFRTILSCAPQMYDELWVAGKCMYKLEPVLADGGELIIYAPHLGEVSVTHGRVLRRIGYHCRDYFLKQWQRFEKYPWGVLAHSTHVYGQGTFEGGIERPRARVTLATRLSESECRQLNLGYRSWESIRLEDYANREADGVLLVPKAGEQLFVLENPPVGESGKS